MENSNIHTEEKVVWYNKLTVQAVCIILFAAVTVLASNAYHGYRFSLEKLEEEFKQSENSSFTQIVTRMDHTILDNVLHLATFSNSHTQKHFFTEVLDEGSSDTHPVENLFEDLYHLKGEEGVWKRIDLIDTKGTIQATTNSEVFGSNIDATSLTPPNAKYVQVGTTKIYDVATYTGVGTALLVVSEIFAWDNTATHSKTDVVGYAVGYLSPEFIFNVSESYTANNRLYNQHKPFVVLQEDGTIIFQNSKNLSSALQARLVQSNTDTTTHTPQEDTQQDYILETHSDGYKAYQGFNWIVFSELDTSSIQKDLRIASFAHIKYYIPAVIFAAVIVFLYIFYFLVAPLSLLHRHLEMSIATGSAKPLKIKNKSEIGKLAGVYNQFIKQIEDRALKLSNTIEEVRGLNSELENTKTAALNVLEDLDEEKRKVDETVKIRTQELVSERQKLMHITENMFVGVILTDESGKPVFVNKQGKEILGIDDDISNALIRLYEKFPSPEVTALINAYAQGKSSVIKEIENENGIFEIMGRCNSLQQNTDQEFFGKGIWIRNITAEKQLERSKSELVAVASHQLRTPLTVTRGNLEMLLDGSFGTVNEKQRELLSDSQESVIRLIAMVNDMLDITKIEKGDKKIVLENVDILEPIEKVVTSFETYTKRYKCTIAVEKPKNAIIVLGDKALLVQILQNLVDNALKYSREDGKVTISFKTRKAYVDISITDNGIGIPSKELAIIFQRFYRASNAVRSTTGGSGLGLFIVKSFVEQMKGTIAVSSKEGEGTTFTISLPLAK